jgi:hypothetical protein
MPRERLEARELGDLKDKLVFMLEGYGAGVKMRRSGRKSCIDGALEAVTCAGSHESSC